MQSKNYSIKDFHSFLQVLPDMSIVNDATARNLRDSSLRLLSVLNDEAMNMDIREVNVSSLATSYMNSTENKPSDSSLQAYKSRMQSAIDKFIAFQNGEFESDENAHPQKRESRRMAAKKKTGTVEQNEVKTFDLPIPLRGDLIVTIGNLPRDLTNEEAKRISNIVESFAIPENLI